MKLRPPAVPLITVDPYFSVWSMADHLTDAPTKHWTGKPNTMLGAVEVDGTRYRFMGEGEEPALRQTGLEVDALSTVYTFEGAGIRLTAAFTTPLLPDDLDLLSRPVSYIRLTADSADGKGHRLRYLLQVSEELCLNERGQDRVEAAPIAVPGGCLSAMGMGSASQPILATAGDDIRIDWGTLVLAAEAGDVTALPGGDGEMTFLQAAAERETGTGSAALFAVAYDDGYSLVYFGERLSAYWKRDGMTIGEAVGRAFAEYPALRERCRAFSDRMEREATRAGGEKYADLLLLAYRQVCAAHKLVRDAEGQVLYISKECFSDGCAATVDVSYPSMPLFLLVNPELVKGMMRPIFRYAGGGEWPFDFAPHDVGIYPLLNGQVYSGGTQPDQQMPVEECGNMLLMTAAVCAAEGDPAFAQEHLTLLETWLAYLRCHGLDPENQLCTDDFAGHLAHNANLSVKAIIAVAAFSIPYRMMGNERLAEDCLAAARSMAKDWLQMADDGDGTFRLAFNQPGTFSMKYNLVWDRLLGTGIFPAAAVRGEFAGYRRHINPYGLPLDSRAAYTKSDWLVWTAALAPTQEEFEEMIAPLWEAYHRTPSRVPMTDWYDTVTSLQVGFQNRTVQGGLFLKLLEASGRCRRETI